MSLQGLIGLELLGSWQFPAFKMPSSLVVPCLVGKPTSKKVALNFEKFIKVAYMEAIEQVRDML